MYDPAKEFRAILFCLFIMVLCGLFIMKQVNESKANTVYKCHDENANVVYEGKGEKAWPWQYWITRSKYDDLEWFKFPGREKMLAACTIYFPD